MNFVAGLNDPNDPAADKAAQDAGSNYDPVEIKKYKKPVKRNDPNQKVKYDKTKKGTSSKGKSSGSR